MKKITNNEDEQYKYKPEATFHTEPKTDTNNEPKVENEYKIVDPKKRTQLYALIAFAFVLVVVLIIVNQSRTRTQTSEPVEAYSFSETVDTTDETVLETDNTSAPVNTTTRRNVPVYTLNGTWKSENDLLILDDKFTYSMNMGSSGTLSYKGKYTTILGESGLGMMNWTKEDACDTFHISKQDFNIVNLYYVKCEQSEFSLAGAAYTPIVQTSSEPAAVPIIEGIVYLTTDKSNNLIAHYYSKEQNAVQIYTLQK